jgi:hypothetical protein
MTVAALFCSDAGRFGCKNKLKLELLQTKSVAVLSAHTTTLLFFTIIV